LQLALSSWKIVRGTNDGALGIGREQAFFQRLNRCRLFREWLRLLIDDLADYA